MNRVLVICCVLIMCVIGLMFFVDSQKPKPLNWQPTYGLQHKNPLGLYVLRQEAQNLFKGDSIIDVYETPYEYFEPRYSYKDSTYRTKGTFININETIQLDRESVQELLYFADHGNTIFLSAKYLPQMLLDTLGISMSEGFSFNDSVTAVSPVKKQPYLFKEGAGITYFTKTDSAQAVLGFQKKDTATHTNYILVKHGYGNFLLHTQPAAFSNYYLLKDDYSSYAEDVLSYIPKGNIYWYGGLGESRISGSPLRYIMSQPGLKAAYWLALAGLLIFILFNAKRRQRIVPQLPPVRNTTIDFTRTIGNLYYNSGDHHATIGRMVVHVLERIRNEYKIDTTTLDEAFTEKLAQKTGRPKDKVQHLVTTINKHRRRTDSSAVDVIEMNKAIENIML